MRTPPLRMLREWMLRLIATFRPQRSDRDLEEELRAHLEMAGERGGLAPAMEAVRDQRGFSWLRDAGRDLRYGWRTLRRAPTFTSVAVLSMALAIGANTAIFSLVNAVLLRELPVADPARLVFVDAAGSKGANGAPPYPCLERFRRESAVFSGLSAFATDQLPVEIDGEVEQISGQVASGNYFDVLGVTAALGRLITPADETLSPPVAVIGYGYWQRRFGGDPHVLGRRIVFKNQVFTIVGVTERRFSGIDPGRRVDITLPITVEGGSLADASTWWLEAIARLRPGVSAEQARLEIDAVFQNFMKDQAASPIRAERFDHMQLDAAARGLGRLRSRFAQPLYGLSIVAGLVLVIACANLGNLLLMRGASRAREFAVRQATGAGSGRIFRQVLTETALLFFCGAAAGLAVAYVGIQSLTSFFAIGRNPILIDVPIDWRLAAFAGGVALAAAIVTGLWPAIRASRADPQHGLREGDGRLAGSPRVMRLSRTLVTLQVAVSFVLLLAAVVFVRTMANLRHVDLGFNDTRVWTMSINPLLASEQGGARERIWTQALQRVRAVPGVRSASLSILTPLSGRDVAQAVEVSGFQAHDRQERVVRVNHVSEDYFRTFGIELVAGRPLLASDTQAAPHVAVINEATSRAYFAARDPIGQRIDFRPGRSFEIVGVVRDAKHRDLREPVPRFVFIPLWQPLNALSRVTLSVASDGSPRVVDAVAAEVRRVFPQTLISDVLRVDQQIAVSLLSERLMAALAVIFAILAMALAAIGVYGVLGYSVAQRRTEIGVRQALGASRARIGFGVLRQLAVEIAIGIGLAVPGAVAVARLFQGLLFGVQPADAANYLISAGVLIAVACIAAALPARRACTLDLTKALRGE